MFENRILKRIFGPKRDANEECRRLLNEELHSLCRSLIIVMVIVYKIEMGRSSSQNGRRWEYLQNYNRSTYRKETFREV